MRIPKLAREVRDRLLPLSESLALFLTEVKKQKLNSSSHLVYLCLTIRLAYFLFLCRSVSGSRMVNEERRTGNRTHLRLPSDDSMVTERTTTRRCQQRIFWHSGSYTDGSQKNIRKPVEKLVEVFLLLKKKEFFHFLHSKILLKTFCARSLTQQQGKSFSCALRKVVHGKEYPTQR